MKKDIFCIHSRFPLNLTKIISKTVGHPTTFWGARAAASKVLVAEDIFMIPPEAVGPAGDVCQSISVAVARLKNKVHGKHWENLTRWLDYPEEQDARARSGRARAVG